MTEHDEPMDWTDDTTPRDSPGVERLNTTATVGPLTLELQSLAQPGTPMNRALVFFIYIASAMLWLAATAGVLSTVTKAPRWMSTAVGTGGAVYILVLGTSRTKSLTAPSTPDLPTDGDVSRTSTTSDDLPHD